MGQATSKGNETKQPSDMPTPGFEHAWITVVVVLTVAVVIVLMSLMVMLLIVVMDVRVVDVIVAKVMMVVTLTCVDSKTYGIIKWLTN